MKKLLILLLSIITLTTYSQTWSAADINGTVHDLSNHSNKAVLVDISAHWCGPCWTLHLTHVMQELYHDFGPNGTDEFMVFWVDGDANSSVSILNGSDSIWEKDWVTGVDYPIIGPYGQGAMVAGNYSLVGYPTLFLHCGSGVAPEIQRPNPALGNEKWTLWNDVLNCSSVFQYQNPDATLLLHKGMKICSSGNEPELEIYNAGAYVNLTSATLELRDPNGTLVHTQQWQGNLSPFAHTLVTLNYLITTPGIWTAKVVLPNGIADTRPNGDEEDIEVIAPITNIHTDITITIVTDMYGSETTWSICDDNLCYMAGGPYSNLSSAGIQTQTPVMGTLPANTCLTFKIEDSYGEGMCCNHGNGGYTITDALGNIIVQGGEFGSKEEVKFETGNFTVNVNEIIYVKPENNRIYDILGREWKCNFGDLPKGIYIINGNKIFKTK